jgi:peroxiredoxin
MKILNRILYIFLSSILVAGTAQAASTEGQQDLLKLGSAAPEFALPDVTDGRIVSLSDFADKKALLVIMLCRHCPFVQHALPGIIAVGQDYADSDIAIVGISSNDADAYPDDSPEGLREMVLEREIPFPVLFDETQETGRDYTAVATPDFFLFDADRKLAYRGQLDDSRPGSGKAPTGADLRAAIDAVLSDKPVASRQKPSVGCSIKWKAE